MNDKKTYEEIVAGLDDLEKNLKEILQQRKENES